MRVFSGPKSRIRQEPSVFSNVSYIKKYQASTDKLDIRVQIDWAIVYQFVDAAS